MSHPIRMQVCTMLRKSVVARAQKLADDTGAKRHAVLLALVLRGLDFYEAHPEMLYEAYGREKVATE